MPWTDPIPALKRAAAEQIVALLDGWSAHQAAALIGTDQPRISDLRRGNLERFSLETLVRYLTRLRQRVELRAEPLPAPVRAFPHRAGPTA
jgi:predicted XRE-type DNA-binding protein